MDSEQSFGPDEEKLKKLLDKLNKNDKPLADSIDSSVNELTQTAREQNLLDAGIDDPLYDFTNDDARLSDSDGEHRAPNDKNIAPIMNKDSK